ncbi:MAG: rhodanese-related sulfurtransferase [Thermoleophilaceae bacterium]|nr:rhodanese-related sulfurtransferase [Thermoleophilaceae bacterium]
MNKVILYYKFVPVPDPETTMLWQRELCEKLKLRGRIIVSQHGINGTLGGDMEDLKAYVRAMNLHSRFKGTEYKWSMGAGDDFPKLSVKVRDELVTLAPGEEFDVFDGGTALRPKAWHKLLTENPDMPVLDARNEYESDIGKFRGAITPKIRAFKEIHETLDQLDKTQPIATYCTGDIRCEYLSAYMKHVGFEEVYHLDGGIVKYGQEFKDQGLWDGKCYVFDKRMNIEFEPDTPDIATCFYCDKPTSAQVNCRGAGCLRHMVVCEECAGSNPLLCANCTS